MLPDDNTFESDDLTDDNTSEETNENNLDDLPDDDDTIEDDDDAKTKADEAAAKAKSSEIAQKIKYREKFQKAQEKIDELEEKIKTLGPDEKPAQSNDKEMAAQKYIQKQALEAIKAYEKEKGDKKNKEVERFRNKLDVAVEDSDFKESEIIDVCEEYEVEPPVAVKILEKINKPKSKKPKMPSSGRGSAEVKSDKDEDETPKKKMSIWDIAQDIKKGIKSKD